MELTNKTFNEIAARVFGLAEISIDSAPGGTQFDMFLKDIHVSFFIEGKYGNTNIIEDYVIPFLKNEAVDLAVALRDCKGEACKIGRMYSGRAYTYMKASCSKKDSIAKFCFNMLNQLSEVTIWLKNDEARKNLIIILDMLYSSIGGELEANLEWLDKTFPIEE